MSADQWRAGIFEHDDSGMRAIEQRLASFVATGVNGQQVLLGSGLILLSEGQLALCATAAHVLEFAADVQQPQRPDQRHYQQLFRLPKNRLRIEPDSFRAVGLDAAGRPHAFVAHQVCRSNSSDVGTVWLAPQAGSEADSQFPKARFPVDASLPKPGSEIVVVGHLQQDVGGQTVQGSNRSFRLTRRIALRPGRVTEVDSVGTYMGIGPNFTTTVPLPPGASRAPIFDLVPAGEPLVVRGLVCSDISTAAAFESTTVAGAGRAASIQSILRLPLSVATQRPIADLYIGEPVVVDLSPPKARSAGGRT